jgi:putative transposase
VAWKKISWIVRRLQFVKLALKAQASMTSLCRSFGFSRKAGYKWKARFVQHGLRGLQDRPRRPHRSPGQVSELWLGRIRRLRRKHRSWGSRKLAMRLRKLHRRRHVPCARAIGKWLKRMKLSRPVRRRDRRGPPIQLKALTRARRSNHVWTVDFKGWFRTQDGRRVNPLTVCDRFSRYLLSVRVLKDQSWEPVRRIFLRLFRRYGYPKVIRMDNGSPFGSTGPAGLSRLSAWWTAMGIRVEFIAPGHPEQNGSHEQMHRILKAEKTRPASRHLLAQQRRLDRWRREYNEVRPHQGLQDLTPKEKYRAPRQRVRGVVLKTPRGCIGRHVRSNGQIKWQGRLRLIGEAFVGYPVGLKSLGQEKYAVYFGKLLIGELWTSDVGGMRPVAYVRRY